MTAFPVTYDPQEQKIVLHGRGGLQIMLAYLLKAKFGERFDPETLFHSDLAKLMRDIRDDCPNPPRSGRAFSRTDCWEIGRAIVEASDELDWWSKTHDERVAYLQDVVAAPHVLWDEDLEDIFDAVQGQLHRARRIARAADEAGEPS